MLNFTIKTPTEVVFGPRNQENRRAHQRYSAHRVLVPFRRRERVSPVCSTALDAACLTLACPSSKLGGVSPTPRSPSSAKGVALCRRARVWISCSPSAAARSSTQPRPSPWARRPARPVGVRTPPAPDRTETLPSRPCSLAASARDQQLLRADQRLKRSAASDETNRRSSPSPQPENTFTVSKFQTGCGMLDIMMHARTLSDPGGGSDLTDHIAEGLLIATRGAGRRAIANPRDYEARATLMWAGSVSLQRLPAAAESACSSTQS